MKKRGDYIRKIGFSEKGRQTQVSRKEKETWRTLREESE